MSADWSVTKPIAAFSCTPSVQVVHTKVEVEHLTPGILGLGVLAKHMINPRISADWSTTKQIAAFSCTPRVQDSLVVLQSAEILWLITIHFLCITIE